MTYAYIRVSARDQNPARQITAIRQYRPEIRDEHIFIDKASGKDFDREKYLILRELLVLGDEVVIPELDRFGRNKEEIKANLRDMKVLGVVTRIMDVPTTLIDFCGQDWIAEMVNNILIEVMGSFAENERVKIRARQREGIDCMPIVNGKHISMKTGHPMGRPVLSVSAFPAMLEKHRRGEITVDEACRELEISRSSWYKLARTVQIN